MDWRIFTTIFGTVFLAELGDKTQLATMLFSVDQPTSKWLVFAASASALVCACAVGVVAGGWLGAHINPKTLKLIAGSGFVLVGLWVVQSAYASG